MIPTNIILNNKKKLSKSKLPAILGRQEKAGGEGAAEDEMAGWHH